MLTEWLLTGMVATALALALIFSSTASQLDNLIYDGVLRFGEKPTRDDIVIVAIDDQSLEELGPWPWPRSLHGRLIERLAAARPRAIAYDVLFLEPSNPTEDTALAQALAAARNVCLPVLIQRPGPDGADSYLRPPLKPLAGAAAGLGHVTLRQDPDGVTRRADLSARVDGALTPHLTACAFHVGTGKSAPGDEMLIPYSGGAGHARTASAVSVLRGEVPEAFLDGTYVLVGVTASGLHDRHATPMNRLGGAMPGVEVQANLLAALLSGGAVWQAGPEVQAAFTVSGVWALMLTLLVLPARRALPFGFAFMVAAVAFSALALAAARLWIPPSALVVTALFVFPLWGWRRLQAASRYMLEELDRFAREPGLLPAGNDHRGDDGVDRQIRLMEQTLQRARDLRRFAAETLRHLPDATLVATPEGHVLFANQAAQRLAHGATPSDANAFLNAWRTPDGDPLALPDPFEASDGVWTSEAAAPNDGAYLVAAAPYRDGQGRHVAWIVRLTDITRLKAAAAEREQVVHLLSHDMRSPQSSILALLETAEPGAIKPAMGRKVAGYARRTLALADHMVQLARAQSDDLDFEVLDLSSVCIEAIDEMWPQAEHAGVHLQSVGADSERLILGERSLMARAIINLLDNAIKFSPRGSVVCCLLRAETGAQGPRAVLDIIDQGPGVPDGVRDKQFKPFQTSGPRRGHRPGAGLGLALVGQVVRRHEGEITCRSSKAGATFTLSFPLADQTPGEAAD